MAAVTKAVAAIDSAVSSNSTTMTTRLTLSAATLSGQGFQTNDDVIVLFFGLFHAANTGTHQAWRLQYNGSTITNPTANPQLDFTSFAASNGETQGYMTRVNLGGTIGDFTLQNQRAGTSANVVIEKARIVVLRCADLGTENVDWFWNKSTSNQAHTTTYVGTSRAAITWTPASATEDWLVLASDHIAMDAANVNAEGRVVLDGSTLVAGDYSEEAEGTAEENTHLMVGIMENVSAASHTISYQSRDDAGTAANDTRESALLLIRAGRFPDLFWHTPVDNGLAEEVSEEIASISASLSAAQDALVLASMRVDVGAADQATWMWVAINGSAQAPVTNPGSDARANAQASDTTDENQCTWMGVLSLGSGAQDLELWANTTSSTSGNAEEITFVCWGLLVPDEDEEWEVEASLAGAGTIAATPETEAESSSSVAGAGAIAGSGTAEAEAEASLAGSGAVTADATFQPIYLAEASLVGSGAVTAEAEPEAVAVASIDGQMALASSAETEHEADAAVAGVGSLGVTGSTEADVDAAVAGTGSVAIEAAYEHQSSGSITGAGAVTSEATTESNADVEIAGAGSVTAEATTSDEREAEAAIPGAGELTAAAETETEAASSLAGSSAFDVATEFENLVAASLQGVGTLAAEASTTTLLEAQLTGAGTITAAATTSGIPFDPVVVAGTYTRRQTVTADQDTNVAGGFRRQHVFGRFE